MIFLLDELFFAYILVARSEVNDPDEPNDKEDEKYVIQ
jgi:hypothetical protein